MKNSAAVARLSFVLMWIVVAIIVLLPFHAFLTVWVSSITGHYISLRLWKEFLLIPLTAGSLYLLIHDPKLRKDFLQSRITSLIGVYCLISLVWGFIAYELNNTTLKAFGYGLIVNLRFLVFFLLVWIIATKSPKIVHLWSKILLIPAALVILVGLLQRFVLPYDVLKHFGYSETTIYPYETVNHNIHYPRIMATLRGANPLGAYLILIISSSSVLFAKLRNRRWLWGIFWLSSFLILIFSYSRGAWLGLLLSLLLVAWVSLKNKHAKNLLIIGLGFLVLICVFIALALRHNSAFENAFLHSDNKTHSLTTSNQAHVSSFSNGVHDLLHEPFGRGIGTAGPASIYNHGKVRLAENYFIQIAQEIGWVGIALFLAINYLVGRELWFRRSDNLAFILLASLVGLTVVNLVSHAWTDDTLAYIWWGLAGVAIAEPVTVKKGR